MRENWIAVARGLKLLTVSIQAHTLAFILLLVGLVGSFCAVISGPAGPKFASWFPILPACTAEIVAVACSITGRVRLLNVPEDVPKGRFDALASFVLGMICRAGLGGYWCARSVGIETGSEAAISWLSISVVCGVASWAIFHRLLRSLAIHLRNTEAMDTLFSVRGMWFVSVGLTACAVGFLRSADSLAVCFSIVLALAALVLLVVLLTHHFSALRRLHGSALREAVRCERDNDAS